MRRRKKILLAVCIAVAAGVVLLAIQAAREFLVPVRFDSDFYGPVASADEFNDDAYADVLAHVDEEGMVHYAGLAADTKRLDEYVRALAAVDPAALNAWPQRRKIAFWTNAYNALTLKLILDNYPIEPTLLRSAVLPDSSIRQIPGAWDKQQYLVAGRRMTLNDIEHNTLRVEFDEPRIHAALVCAAMGCPPLRNEPFTAEKLDAQMDDQTRKFLAHSDKFRIDRDAGVVWLSSVFQWFGDDFVKRDAPAEGFGDRGDAERASLNFISRYVPAAAAAYLRAGAYRVEYLDYDWSLNERSTPPGEEGSP